MSSSANKQQPNQDDNISTNETVESTIITEVSTSSEQPETKNKALHPQDSNNIAEEKIMEFTRQNVEALGNAIRVTDQDMEQELDLLCYVKCENNDSNLVKQCRGVVFHKNKVVMKTFPYIDEYTTEDMTILEDLCSDMKNLEVFESHEGALVRLFHWGDKWYVTTHRKLNAFRSKWSCKDSFGTLFKRALDSEEKFNKDFAKLLPIGDNILGRFQTTLDTNNQYMFLIRNTEENRIVCSSPKTPMVYHVGTYIDGKLNMDHSCGIPKPEKKHFLNVDQLVKYVHDIDIRCLQGVICFSGDYHFKVLNLDYKDLFEARGNEPSIKFRYLQIRMNRRMTNMLFHLYPNYATHFDDYENCIFEICRQIYNSYIQRFIKHKYVTLPREEYSIMKFCHSWHLENRKENRISLDKVIDTLNKQSATSINHMIKRYKTEQIKIEKQPKPCTLQGSNPSSPEPNTNILPSGIVMVSPLLTSIKRETTVPETNLEPELSPVVE